ncbi:alpha/beta hydrolase [Paenibacillus sp. D2_2]|uniref:alpha/beta hydrolase n=1 Tax=Paenibacillus sp. D2_2 TaxID=3073092 RepID=UPI002815F00F|nr:alpha/beta hydrolase [Paenibacillus sp. D2_2]WMT40964.1 alpha/beta hydrolase [Paenibacillus sp. D2_2]
MKKTSKILGIISLSILIIIALFFVGVFINNKIQLSREGKKIVSYGETVVIDGKKMQFQISGKGEKTIVLLPGYMTAAPIIDFKQLINELEKNYRVIAVEPFGYGLSDDTDKERSVENLTEEIHEVLVKQGINKYTIMGHSISGVYSLEYIKKYPHEVEAFIGIDNSLPSQGGADDNKEGTIEFLSKSGLFRLLSNMNANMLNIPDVGDKLGEQYKYISLKNIGSKATMNEGKSMLENFNKTAEIQYPKSLPVLYFLATESTDTDDNWLKIHQDMVKNSEKSAIKIIKGGHYLHHTESKQLAEFTASFLE